MLLSWTVSYFRERLWVKREPELVHQIQAQPQPLQYSKNAAHIFLVVLVLAGVFGSFWLFWSMNGNMNLLRTEMLSNMCDERARMLQDQFNVSMNHVHALAILVSTFHHGKQPSAIDQVTFFPLLCFSCWPPKILCFYAVVFVIRWFESDTATLHQLISLLFCQKTFAQYTERTAFERPLTSGVAYAVKVIHSEREQFEKHHGWTIKKMDKGDRLNCPKSKGQPRGCLALFYASSSEVPHKL